MSDNTPTEARLTKVKIIPVYELRNKAGDAIQEIQVTNNGTPVEIFRPMMVGLIERLIENEASVFAWAIKQHQASIAEK